MRKTKSNARHAGTSSHPELKVDWCSFDAAKYAVMNWHYSKAMPSGKLVRIGVWEDGRFTGAVLYGLGATPMLCRPYGLQINEVAELVRVALSSHQTPVSRILALSLKMIKKICPKLRIVVSFADKNQGHHGGIYQASNWIYTGESSKAKFGTIGGRIVHPRTISAMKKRDPSLVSKLGYVVQQGKHRYVMPLDEEMRRQVQQLSKPYPKRVTSTDSGVPDFQSGGGGASPTVTLSE